MAVIGECPRIVHVRNLRVHRPELLDALVNLPESRRGAIESMQLNFSRPHVDLPHSTFYAACADVLRAHRFPNMTAVSDRLWRLWW